VSDRHPGYTKNRRYRISSRSCKNARTKNVLAAAITAASLLAVCSPVATVAAQKQSLVDKLALFPLKSDQNRSYLKNLSPEYEEISEEVSIPGPHGNKLDGLLISKPDSKFIYLVNHGNGGNLGHLVRLASLLASTGQSVLIYDYEGYGRSEGVAKLANLTPDGCSAFDYLVNTKNYKPEQIILYGESIGTGPTACIMSQRQAGGVILQSGFTSLLTAGREKLWPTRVIPGWIFREPHFDNLKAVRNPHPPLLFIHGDEDDVLSVSYSRKMFQEALEPKKYFEVKGAGHNDISRKDPDGLREVLAKFMLDVERSGDRALSVGP
jgi:pimeloyl-ACP methyl ester carboxylesterase